MELVRKLEHIQQQQGLTNSEMARLLGVSTSTWAQTRRGELPLGDRVRRGAARLRGKHSDLTEAVLASLEE